YSRLRPNHRLAARVRFLAASAAEPDRPISSVTIGWNRTAPATLRLAPLDATTALDLLMRIVDLRDRGQCEPLPLYCATSYAYADAVNQGVEFPEEAAFDAWTSGFKWPR